MLVKKIVDGVEVEVEESEPTVMEGMEDLLEDFKAPENPEAGDLLNFLNEPDKPREIPEKKEIPEENKDKEPEQKPEEQKEEPLKKEEPVKEPTVVEMYEAQLATMREEMNKLIASISRDGKSQIFPPVENKETPPATLKEEPAKQKNPINVSDSFKKLLEKKEFLSQEQMDEVVDHPEHINSAIAKNREDIVETMASVLEDITSNIPLLVNVMVNREIVMNKAVTSFYEANEDLAPYGKVVQYVFEELEGTHPKDRPFEELFQKVAVESRKRLGLKEPLRSEDGGQPISTNANSKKPAFAGSKQTATPLAKTGEKKMFDENAVDLFYDENK